MIERLRHALEHIEELPEAEQERLAERIERYYRPRSHARHADQSQPPGSASRFAGVWRDLPDDMEDTLAVWRKASIPTPPISEQLQDLDTQDGAGAGDQ